jgi:hypothetical protein
MFASGHHASFPDPVTPRIHAPILQKCRFSRFVYPLAKEKSLIIEGEKYGRLADAQLTSTIDGAKKCSGQTTIPRGTYDLGREWLGLTTILPEQATRIDFEELRRGNLAGGNNSVINETGRKIDETFNPFRWKF